MSRNLYTASQQWASRPVDERFSNLQDLLTFQLQQEKGTHVTDIDPEHFRTEAQSGEIVALGRQNAPAKFSHTGFSHLSQAVDFSATELRKLVDTPTLVSNILNNRIKARQNGLKGWKLVSYQNGDIRARAFVSDKYGFASNSQIIDRVMRQKGWRVPPARPSAAYDELSPEQREAAGVRPATAADITDSRGFGDGLSVNIGDLIAPAGLYASWDDMFIFIVNENRRLNSGLARGAFIWQNSVKKRRVEITSFYYNSVCGNHIVWDASGVQRSRIIHLGDSVDMKIGARMHEIFRQAESGTEQDEARISAAKRTLLGEDEEKVVGYVTTKFDLTAKDALAALQLAEEHPEDHEGSDPKSVWGFVNGLTRVSQTKGFTDARTALDLTAGKILETVSAASATF